MSNIIDSIQLSGVTYQIQGSGGGGVPESTFTAYTATTDERISQDEEVTAAGLNALNDKITPTVELTQAQYDALVTSGTVAQDTYYIITDAQAGDLTNYYTKTETNTLLGGKADTATTYTKTEVDAALDGKQATLVSGTNIKTINNESILGSGNIDIQGGGSSYTAGRGIDITNETISFNLPISAGTGANSVIEGNISNKASGTNSHAEGYNTTASGSSSHAEGNSTVARGYYSHVEGVSTNAYGHYSHAEGVATITNNQSEHASGQYNISNKATNAFGDSGNTLFSVGNGEDNLTKHNAFEIRQNGDIYLSLNGQDVKLQDQLGGGGTVDQTIISGSTNAVAGGAVYNKIDEVEQVTARALNELNDAVSGKQDTLVSGTNIKTINNQSLLGSGNIDIQGGGGGTVESAITSGSTNAVESKAIWSATTYNKGVLLTFDEYRASTNYPEGCGKIKVENIGSHDIGNIYFNNDEGRILGNINISNNNGNISVDTSRFEGASYEIDGTTVIINYPSTGITSVQMYNSWTCTAVVEGAWMNENTYMNVEVDAIASGLQNNINSKLDATAYTPTVVDSALNVASTNPVQNQVLYPELRIDNGETETTLAFENRESTNYPNGCTKLIVEVAGSNNNSNIDFLNGDRPLGNISINNWGSIYVNINFDGASYEISGTTVIITYPTVTSVTKIRVNNNGNYVFKAIVALATSLKDQVLANTNKIDEVEEVTAAGLNALNDNFGGLKLVKLTEAEYNALATKDSSTLYVIVN